MCHKENIDHAWSDWRSHWTPKADLLCAIASAAADFKVNLDLDALAEEIEDREHQHFGGDYDIEFPSLLELAIERCEARQPRRALDALKAALAEQKERHSRSRQPRHFAEIAMQDAIIDAARPVKP